MVVSSRTLEITVISGENVRVKEEAYVVVRAESLNSCTTRTAKDDGNNFLSWNDKFLLDVPMHARSITFEVQCNSFKACRPLGVARIALSDFLGAAAVPDNGLQVFSYGLRDWEGKRNGVIRFAVRVVSVPVPVPVPTKGCRFNGGDNKSNDVVVGVPFCWTHPHIV